MMEKQKALNDGKEPFACAGDSKTLIMSVYEAVKGDFK